VIELGNAKGIDFQLQDRGGLGHAGLMAARKASRRHGSQDPSWPGCGPTAWDDVPQYRITVDLEKRVPWGFRSLLSQHHFDGLW